MKETKAIKEIRLASDLDLTWLKTFRDQVRSRHAKDPDSQAFDIEAFQELHRGGILQLVTPTEYGGKGAKVIDLAWVIREIGMGSASVAVSFIGNMLGYTAFVMYANDELRKRVCERYMSEFSLWSFGMTEGTVGSDLMNIKTTAQETADGFVITGEKNFITNANHSAQMVVFARHIGQGGEDRGISCFFVNGDATGLRRGPAASKIGCKRANTGTLIFDRVLVPHGNLLGEAGKGLRILTHCLNRSKTLLGALGVGVSLRAMELTHERLLETERFGKPLLDQPAIRHLLARLHTKIEMAWLLTCQASSVWDAGLPAVREASMAKMVSGATAVEVATNAMELFGSRGYLDDYEISLIWRDAKLIEIVEGPTMVQELLIAKEVLPSRRSKASKSEAFDLQKSDFKKAS